MGARPKPQIKFLRSTLPRQFSAIETAIAHTFPDCGMTSGQAGNKILRLAVLGGEYAKHLDKGFKLANDGVGPRWALVWSHQITTDEQLRRQNGFRIKVSLLESLTGREATTNSRGVL